MQTLNAIPDDAQSKQPSDQLQVHIEQPLDSNNLSPEMLTDEKQESTETIEKGIPDLLNINNSKHGKLQQYRSMNIIKKNPLRRGLLVLLLMVSWITVLTGVAAFSPDTVTFYLKAWGIEYQFQKGDVVQRSQR